MENAMFTEETLCDVFGQSYELLIAIGALFVFCLAGDLLRRYKKG